MAEWRRHARVKESIDIRWAAASGLLGGQGNATVRNLSISGLWLEVGENFKPVEDGQYVLDVADSKLATVIPKDVRLVWFNRMKTDRMRSFCGMKFVNSEGPVFTRLVEYVESKRSFIGQATNVNIIQNYLSQSN